MKRVLGGALSSAAFAARPLAARPVLSASLAAFAAFSGVVATNALVSQDGRHVRPILATRGNLAAAVDAEPGDEGSTPGLSVPLVAEVQAALAEAGYYGAVIDGRPGKATSAAIRKFQGERGIAVDGEASPRLLAALRAAATEHQTAGEQRMASLEPQSTAATTATDAGREAARPDPLPNGELVRLIQEALASAGIAELRADGIMGRQTEAAIRSFQASQGLDVTGAADETVFERLQSVIAERR